jgi:putative nucleotidyltransferase with HDIG domain
LNPSYLADKLWYETELNFLFKFNEKLLLVFNFQDAAKCITEAAHSFLPIERALLLTWDKNSQNLTLACAIGWGHNHSHKFSVAGKDSISGFVVQNREKLVVSDLSKESYLNKFKKEEYFQKAFISVPLIFKDEVLGVLNVCDKKTAEPFLPREVSVVMNIARMGAITLQNTRLYEQIHEDYLRMIGALAAAVDARDSYTRFHSENVSRYAVAIAEKMHCHAYEVKLIKRAAILHDIGKIGIRDDVLLKTEKLTSVEFEHIKQHSVKGEEMIKTLKFLVKEAVLIRHHHEKYDGSGYPDGLKDEDIELGARILAVADAFDAMTTDRPHRRAVPVEDALNELQLNRGTHFDPEIVACFQDIVKQNPSIVHFQK